MKLSYLDVLNSMEWAIANCGEDNPAEVMAYKLLEQIAKSHRSNSGYHDRQFAECETAMREIEARFKVEDEAAF